MELFLHLSSPTIIHLFLQFLCLAALASLELTLDIDITVRTHSMYSRTDIDRSD